MAARVFQLRVEPLGEDGRPEAPVTADVDPSQENHERHRFLLPRPESRHS